MHIVCAYRVLICVLVAGAWPGVEVLFNENKDLAIVILYIAADEQLDQGWVAFRALLGGKSAGDRTSQMSCIGVVSFCFIVFTYVTLLYLGHCMCHLVLRG